MDKIIKIKEYGNYLLTINNDNDKKLFINNVLLNCETEFQADLFISRLRNEDINENKFDKLKDKDNNDVIIEYRSQIYQWFETFGLENNQENYNKLLEYLDYFLTVKNQL